MPYESQLQQMLNGAHAEGRSVYHEMRSYHAKCVQRSEKNHDDSVREADIKTFRKFFPKPNSNLVDLQSRVDELEINKTDLEARVKDLAGEVKRLNGVVKEKDEKITKIKKENGEAAMKHNNEMQKLKSRVVRGHHTKITNAVEDLEGSDDEN